MRLFLLFTAVGLVFVGCSRTTDIELEKASLLEADRAFCAESIENGAPAAFDLFMADTATILRDRAHPFTGRQAINQLFADWPGGILAWEPIFADVSLSGDLGYTIGSYEYTDIDSLGNQISSSGYYVTIWKKQANDSWKYVFDTGTQGLPEEPN